MYIAQAYKGRHELWMYVVGVIAVVFGWQFVGAVPLLVGLVLKSKDVSAFPTTPSGMAAVLGSNAFLVLMLLTFVFGMAFLLVYVKYVHKLSLKAFTTTRAKIDWKRIWFAFFFWGFVSGGLIFLDVQLAPENYVFNFDINKFLPLLAIVLLLIPIQTSFEEYFMRGYLMQGLGTAVKNRWVPLLVTSSIFGILHIFNPEVDKLGYGIMVFYIGTGLFLGIITLMDDGLELALGFHAANNIVAALLVTADWTAFTTDSVYRDISDPVLGWDVLIPVFVIFPILLLIFSRVYRWTDWTGKLFGKVPPKSETVAIDSDVETLA